MTIDKYETEILQKILIGELMATKIMNIYAKDIKKEEQLNSKLHQWIDEHKGNADKLKSYLLSHGEKVEEHLNIIGYMAQGKAVLNTWLHSEPLDILHEIYDGEDKGLARSVQLSKGKLTPEGTHLIEGIFQIDHDHLQEMKKMITNYENKLINH